MKCRHLETAFKKIQKAGEAPSYKTFFLCKLKMGDELKAAHINRFLLQKGFQVKGNDDSCTFCEDQSFESCPIKNWGNPKFKESFV